MERPGPRRDGFGAFADAALLGVTVTAAAGDSGSGDSDTGPRPHVDFPAASPHVLACGGTNLQLDGSGAVTSETVWNDGQRRRRHRRRCQRHLPAARLAGARPACRTARAGRPPAAACPTSPATPIPQTGYQRARRRPARRSSAVRARCRRCGPAIACRMAQALDRPRLGLLQPVIYKAAQAGQPTPGFRDITHGDNGAYKAGDRLGRLHRPGRARRPRPARGAARAPDSRIGRTGRPTAPGPHPTAPDRPRIGSRRCPHRRGRAAFVRLRCGVPSRSGRVVVRLERSWTARVVLPARMRRTVSGAVTQPVAGAVTVCRVGCATCGQSTSVGYALRDRTDAGRPDAPRDPLAHGCGQVTSSRGSSTRSGAVHSRSAARRRSSTGVRRPGAHGRRRHHTRRVDEQPGPSRCRHSGSDSSGRTGGSASASWPRWPACADRRSSGSRARTHRAAVRHAPAPARRHRPPHRRRRPARRGRSRPIRNSPCCATAPAASSRPTCRSHGSAIRRRRCTGVVGLVPHRVDGRATTGCRSGRTGGRAGTPTRPAS